MIRVRFAPPPAAHVSVSSARVALANCLFARSASGQMLLRIDDLDPERMRPAFAAAIMQDLRWFGVEWDMVFRQSERIGRYHAVIERLKRDRFLYPCFESEQELKAKQEFRRKRNQSSVYDRAMLSLTEKQRQDAEAGGKRPYWRFKLSGRVHEWHDLILGPRRAALSAVSDPILVREDGSPAPILAGVVDDIDFGTTHIIRGEDNAGNTACQIELFEVLGGTETRVRFGHLPPPGEPAMSSPGLRRAPGLSLRGLRNDGVEPIAIAACMTGDRTGGQQAGEPPRLDDLTRRFDLASLAASGFDVGRLLAINRAVLGSLDFTAVAPRLPGGATQAFWLAVRGNLDLLKEARGWWDVVAGTIVPPVIEGARPLLLTACELLPPEPWAPDVWTTWITALEDATGRSGDALLAPLRLALTGEDSGPDLAELLPLIGRARAAGRLSIAAA